MEEQANLEREVKEELVFIAKQAYPMLDEIDTLTYSLLNVKNPRVHSEYTFKTRHINVYNVTNQTKEELVAISLHSLSHHLEYLQNSEASHSKRFYQIFYKVVCKAIELHILDYNKAIAQKLIEPTDISLIEKYSGNCAFE